MYRLLFVLLLSAACGGVKPEVKYPELPKPGCVVLGSNHYGEIPTTCDTLEWMTQDAAEIWKRLTGKPCDPSGIRAYWINGPLDIYVPLAGVYYPLLGLLKVRTNLEDPDFSWDKIFRHELGHHCSSKTHPDWDADADHCFMDWSGYTPVSSNPVQAASDKAACIEAGYWPPPGL